MGEAVRFKKKEAYNQFKTHFKEGDINEELIDKMVELSGKYCSFRQAFNPSVFSMGLFGAAQKWGDQKGCSLPRICHTIPTMMKFGPVIPY